MGRFHPNQVIKGNPACTRKSTHRVPPLGCTGRAWLHFYGIPVPNTQPEWNPQETPDTHRLKDFSKITGL